jgi:hypothetical protein
VVGEREVDAVWELFVTVEGKRQDDTRGENEGEGTDGQEGAAHSTRIAGARRRRRNPSASAS